MSKKEFPKTTMRMDLNSSGWIRLLLWKIPVEQLIYVDADVVIMDLPKLVSTARRSLSKSHFAAAPLDPWVVPQRLNVGVMFIRPNIETYMDMEAALVRKDYFKHPTLRAGGFLDQAWIDLWWTAEEKNAEKTMVLSLNLNLPVSFPALNWDPVGTHFCVDTPVIAHFMGDVWKPFDRSDARLLSKPERLWWTNYRFWCRYRKTPCFLKFLV